MVCISGCRGVIGFNAAMSRVLSAKKFALLGLIVGASAKKFARARKMAQNHRSVARWANFFVNTPLEGSRRASFFAG